MGEVMKFCQLKEFCTVPEQRGKLRLARRGIHQEYVLIAIQDIVDDGVELHYFHGEAYCLEAIFPSRRNSAEFNDF